MNDHIKHRLITTSGYTSAIAHFPLEKLDTQFTMLVRSSSDGILVINKNNRIVLQNLQAERMFGYKSRQLLGRSLNQLVPLRFHQREELQIGRLCSTHVHRRNAKTKMDFTGLRATGDEFPFEARGFSVRVGTENFYALVLREKPFSDMPEWPPFKESELRRMAISSQLSTEVEKRRFSKELYDELGQRLTVLKLDLDWLETKVSTIDDELALKRITQMQQLLDNAIASTKNIASMLRPPLLDDFGVLAAIEWLVEAFRKRTGIECRLESNNMFVDRGNSTESGIFRIVQECLSYIERHAQATHVRIFLQRKPRHFHILIEDNGAGLTAENENRQECREIVAMKERIYILGGTMSVQNMASGGTAVHASLPHDQPSIKVPYDPHSHSR